CRNCREPFVASVVDEGHFQPVRRIARDALEHALADEAEADQADTPKPARRDACHCSTQPEERTTGSQKAEPSLIRRVRSSGEPCAGSKTILVSASRTSARASTRPSGPLTFCTSAG